MSTFRTRSFRKEDFAKLCETDPRFEEFLTAFNAMGKQLETVLNGGVGRDNLNSAILQLDISKSQKYPLKAKNSVKGKPLGVRILRCVKTTTMRDGEPCGVAPHVDWTGDSDTISIDGVAGLDAAESYRLTLEIVGG